MKFTQKWKSCDSLFTLYYPHVICYPVEPLSIFMELFSIQQQLTTVNKVLKYCASTSLMVVLMFFWALYGQVVRIVEPNGVQLI